MWVSILTVIPAFWAIGGTVELGKFDKAMVGAALGCECVPFYLCANNTIISDGSTLIDVRIMDFECPSILDVCCHTNLQKKSDVFVSGNEIKGCGIHNPKGVDLEASGYRGNEAYFGEFPWMVAVLEIGRVDIPYDRDRDQQNLFVYLCGGSLIHPSVVLTAGHCVAEDKKNHIMIRAGEWNTQSKNEIYRHQDRMVKDVVLHEEFISRNLFNDIALLFLAEAVTPAKNIGFICLPPPMFLPDHGTRCLASGWGKNLYGSGGQYQSVLKKVAVPIVDRHICQDLLRNTRLGRHFQLHESFMCAGGEPGIDTCKGDGGSPLACPLQSAPGRFIQSGIVAWGIDCGIENTPAVYVNVAYFRDWIDSAMAQSKLNTSYYCY